MKNLKITILLSFLLVIVSANAQSVSVTNNSDWLEDNSDFKSDISTISLSSDLKASFKEITMNYLSEKADIMAKGTTAKEIHDKLEIIQTKRNAEMKAILSEKQYKKYVKIQDEREAILRDRYKG